MNFFQEICPFFSAFKSVELVDKTLIIKVEKDLPGRIVYETFTFPAP